MSESSIKPIQINPELFNMKKNKTQKNKSLKIRNIQPNKLKNDLKWKPIHNIDDVLFNLINKKVF